MGTGGRVKLTMLKPGGQRELVSPRHSSVHGRLEPPRNTGDLHLLGAALLGQGSPTPGHRPIPVLVRGLSGTRLHSRRRALGGE